MAVLTSYYGVVEREGIVRLRQAPALPTGTEVVVVVARPLPSLEDQAHHQTTLAPEDWHKPFDEFAIIVAQEQAEVDIADVSDEELVALVHEARQARA